VLLIGVCIVWFTVKEFAILDAAADIVVDAVLHLSKLSEVEIQASPVIGDVGFTPFPIFNPASVVVDAGKFNFPVIVSPDFATAPSAVRAFAAVVDPVPPLAIARVPARVTAPVVAVAGVNPVVPAEIEVTPALAAVV
jgi:hypothetical protein